MKRTVPLSLMHEVEGIIDVSKGHSMRDKLVDFQLACQIVLHKTRYILSTLPAWVRGGEERCSVWLQNKSASRNHLNWFPAQVETCLEFSWFPAQAGTWLGFSMAKVAGEGTLLT